MQQPMNGPGFDVDQEYRAIEATLLESTTGRWFLAEHGRRSRRLDSAVLEAAIGKLHASLRQPPALLGQLQAEIGELRLFLAQAREELLKRRAQPNIDGTVTDGSEAKPADGKPEAAPTATAAIMRAAEDMHELAWGLHAKEIDPAACAAIAKHASIIYAMSVQQAATSERILSLAAALDQAGTRLAAVLETIAHELQIDKGSEAEAQPALLDQSLPQLPDFPALPSLDLGPAPEAEAPAQQTAAA